MILNLQHKISKQSILDLLDTAGRGANYWLENCLEYESQAKKAMTEKGIIVKDLEEEKKHCLNKEKIGVGLSIMAKKYPGHFIDFIKENYDQTTGDVFLQCCLFKKVIYS